MSRSIRTAAVLMSVLIGTSLAMVPVPGFAQADDEIELITAPQLPASSAAASPRAADTAGPGEAYRRELAAGKRRAETVDPAIAAQQADDLEEFLGPESLSHTINVTFPGLDFSTSQASGSGSLVPHTGIAASNTRVLEVTRYGLRLSSTAGTTLASTNFNAFFSAAIATFQLVGDARVYFDRTGPTPRFFIVATSTNFSTKVSKMWLAVSRGAGPADLGAAAWCRYKIEARMNAGTADDSWAYQPAIGMGADALVIAVDNLTWSVANFRYNFVRTFKKLVLENNAGGCPSAGSLAMKVFKASNAVFNDDARSLQPVQHYNSPPSYTGVTNPMYLIATDPLGFSSEIRIWRVANVASGTPTFVGPYVIPGGLSYDIPPDARQKGSSTVLLETWDTRLAQAAGLGNTLHGVFATTCNFSGGNPEACIRYVRVGISGPTLGGAYQQQITFGAAGAFYWAPGVAVNLAGKVLVVFQRSNSMQYLNTMYTGKAAGATVFEAPNPMPAGTCTDDIGNPAGTSEVTGAQTDPGGVAFWLAGERASPVTGYSGCWWTTDVRKVTPP